MISKEFWSLGGIVVSSLVVGGDVVLGVVYGIIIKW